MEPQNFQVHDQQVIRAFVDWRRENPTPRPPLKLSWSNWGFGIEPLQTSAARLARHGVRYIELHGNRYGPDLGYKSRETQTILDDHGIQVAGVCGMVSPESELSSNKPHVTQRCIDYFRRNIEMCAELGGSYILFTPGAVGRPEPYDANEFHRAAEAIRILGDDFVRHGIRAGIEPVRAAEVSFCHSFAEAKALIERVGHPGVQHIAGDLYHMLVGEQHIGRTILDYGRMMVNLHMADTNRMALGSGMLDLDLVLMALYVVGYHEGQCFCTPEPLGPGGDPYPQMWGSPDPAMLDELVAQTASYFYRREQEILSASDEELLRRLPAA